MMNFKIKFLVFIFLLLPHHIFADSLEKMISNLLIDKLGGGVLELELSFDNKSKILLPDVKNIGAKNVSLTYFAPSYSSFRVSVTAKNDKLFDLFGRYKAYINVPIMAKSVSVGTIITETDIISVKSPLSRVKNGYVTSVDDIVGMQARRSLANGALVRNSDVIKPQIVRQGDSVSILYDKGNIKLRTNGIAMQGGAMNDNIKVKNESTGTVIHAIVKEKNLVEVGV